MNKFLVAGVLLLLGGFLLGDASGLNLGAKIGGDGRPKATPSGSMSPRLVTEIACKDLFKQAEEQYKMATRTAKEKYEIAVKTKTACLKQVAELRKSVSPKPTRSANPTTSSEAVQ